MTTDLPNVVALVFDRSFAQALAALSTRAHVWIVDSPDNRAAAAAVRVSSGARVVTTFYERPEWPMSVLLDDIVQHHPACSQLELFGLALNDMLLEELAGCGFLPVGNSVLKHDPVVFVRVKAE